MIVKKPLPPKVSKGLAEEAAVENANLSDDGTEDGTRSVGSATLITVSDVVAMYRVSRSFAYGLKRWIPFYKWYRRLHFLPFWPARAGHFFTFFPPL